MAQSNSVGWATSNVTWVREHLAFLKMRLDTAKRGLEEARKMVAVSDHYQDLYARYTGKNLKGGRILEVGYGQRPWRLMILASLGYRARGIDLDKPLLKPSIAGLIEVARQNGATRAIKTAVRQLLFDRGERDSIAAALKERGATLRYDDGIFLVGNAVTFDFEPGSLDFVYSEDVFEHIAADDLDRLCEKMATWLSADGLAVITPCVFASLPGGHLAEWFPFTLKDQGYARRSQPWDHLRDREVRADCYLNELKLADYRAIFARHLEILDEADLDAGIGQAYLTPELRATLGGYETQELVGSRFRFILRRKRG